MKSKTLQKLASVISTISTRGVGHTTLMKKGTDSYDRPFGIISHSTPSGKEILGENQNGSVYTIDTIDNMRGAKMPVIFDNHILAKFLGDIHWELESAIKTAEGARKNQKIIMDFFEEYQNMAIDAEYVLMDYVELPWWKIAKKRSLMSKYIWLSNKRVSLFQELLMKIKPGRLDEILNN
jgi:hypothetical protein